MKIIFAFLMFLSSHTFVPADSCSFFEKVFQNKQILSYLHTNVPGRSTLYLVENEFCTLNKQLGRLTIVTVNEKGAAANKNYLKITSVKDTPKGKTIYLSYPIEGACFVININSNGEITNIDVNEF